MAAQTQKTSKRPVTGGIRLKLINNIILQRVHWGFGRDSLDAYAKPFISALTQQKTNLVTRSTQQSGIDRVEVCYTKNPLHASQVQCGGGKQSRKASKKRRVCFLVKETGQRQFSELLKNV